MRHAKIRFLEATLQSFYLKFAFLFYGLPVLILSDILGILSVVLIDKVPILKGLNNNPLFFGILYFSLGLLLITYIVSKIEFNIFSHKWSNVETNGLRRTVTVSNTVIFAVALILIVVSKEYMT